MIISILLLCISLSIDAFAFGVIYGMKGIGFPIISKLLICFFSIIYALFAQLIGKSFSSLLNPSVSKYLGVLILIVMGIVMLIKTILKCNKNKPLTSDNNVKKEKIFKFVIKSLGITIQIIKNPLDCDIDKSGMIDPLESLLLGFSLSVDAIGAGIGVALSGLYSMFIPIFIGIFQYVFLCTGLLIGNKIKLRNIINQKYLEYLPGILLIILGLVRL